MGSPERSCTMLLRALKSLLRSPTATATGFSEAFALFGQGKLDEAERACADVRNAPAADLSYLRGLIAERRGHLQAALSHFRAAAEARSEEPSFHFSIGETLLALGDPASALVELELFLSLAPAGDGRRVKATLTCADCCWASGHEATAQEWRQRAMDLTAGDAAAAYQVADACYEDSDVDRARACLAPIPGALATAALIRRAMMLPAIYASRDHIKTARERLENDLDDLLGQAVQAIEAPESLIGVLPFYLAYHNENNAELMRKVCRVMRRAYPAAMTGAAPRRDAGARIKVGFVSTYFSSHSIGRITQGLIRDLPRQRFEVFVFAIAPVEDAMNQAIRRNADCYVALPNSVEAAVRAIGDASLDTLLFADIGMHPTTYFLALHRLARLQVALWGHPETTGIDTIDCYFTAKGVETSRSEGHYTERLIRPDAFFLGGFARPAAATPLTRDRLGLPPDARLYGCLQPTFKHHPDMDGVFARILDSDPQAHILLLQSRPAWAAKLRARFQNTIAGGTDRIRWLAPMPHAQFMATLAACDVSLDPLYFGGGNSSCESLSLGVPTITLPGTHAYGRLTYALYREMGMDDCIVDSIESYSSTAVRMATSRSSAEWRRETADRSSVLFERKDIAVAMADFLERELR